MYRFKRLFVLFLTINFVTISQAQNEDVKIEVPGKASLSYDGARIQIESSNTLIGQNVGLQLTTGLDNTFLGKDAGIMNSTGKENTYLGASTGINNTGSGNVFIGYGAGSQETFVINKLYIANSNTTTPLIYGDFLKEELEFNAELNVKGHLLVDFSTIIEQNLTVQGMLEIENGDITLPSFTGATSGNLEVDASGKLVKSSSNRMVFNQYEFHEKEVFSFYTKLVRGVQFADGTVLTGISALIKDNDTSGNTGIGNTTFVGLYRLNKITGTNNTIELIYHITASDTATGTHEPFTQTTLVIPGADVIDNDNYIYFIQVWYCEDCGVTEVEILEE